MTGPAGPAALHVAPAAHPDTYRIIAAHLAPPDLLRDIAAPGDIDAVMEVVRLTGIDADRVVGTLAHVPVGDRPTGPGAGWALLAFTQPARPSRFTDGRRGVWYAGYTMQTAIAETSFHDERLLRAFGEPPQARPKQVLRASLTGMMIDVRSLKTAQPSQYAQLHDPDPSRYGAPQRFGQDRYDAGDDGIIYDSVRDQHPIQGTCVAVLRPRAVRNPRRVATVTYHWNGSALMISTPTAV